MNAPGAKPPVAGIRPGLWLLLAVVGAAAWWLSGQDEAQQIDAGRADRAPTRSAPRSEEPQLEPTRKRAIVTSSSAAAQAAAQGPDWLARLQQASLSGASRAAFAPLSAVGRQAWSANLPPPPPPPPPAPPPRPVAPAFPYQMVGRWEEPPRPAAGPASTPPAASAAGPAPAAHSVALAVITGPQSTWVVKAGDVIEGQWRIDAVTASAVNLTYLPLSQPQTVAMKRP